MIDVERFIKGDEEELEKLMSQLTQPLMRYCTSILLNFADAEDAVQATFIQVYKKKHTLKNPQALKSFTYSIAYSVCIDIIRSRKLFFPLKEEIKADENINGAYFSEPLRQALLKLTPLNRSIVYRRIVEGYSYKDLSLIHNRSEAALRKRYERARKKLQKHLKAMNYEKESDYHGQEIYKG